MQVIGFNFTKISAKRELKIENYSQNTNIEFLDLEKEKIELLKDLDAIKIIFKYSVEYKSNKEKEKPCAELIFEGHIVLALSKKESSDILKSWKKKQIPPNIQISLFNLILKKCSPKAVYIADELNIPSPVPLPKITPKQKEE
ncbi:hypothetical protein J4462_00310 [Candidatus Pacearchaeota archaeon]|nr:hypothetical protein [Candidatus Pacearchaeota archaeon]